MSDLRIYIGATNLSCETRKQSFIKEKKEYKECQETTNSFNMILSEKLNAFDDLYKINEGKLNLNDFIKNIKLKRYKETN